MYCWWSIDLVVLSEIWRWIILSNNTIIYNSRNMILEFKGKVWLFPDSECFADDCHSDNSHSHWVVSETVWFMVGLSYRIGALGHASSKAKSNQICNLFTLELVCLDCKFNPRCNIYPRTFILRTQIGSIVSCRPARIAYVTYVLTWPEDCYCPRSHSLHPSVR